jgi:hypothetical protein
MDDFNQNDQAIRKASPQTEKEFKECVDRCAHRLGEFRPFESLPIPVTIHCNFQFHFHVSREL